MSSVSIDRSERPLTRNLEPYNFNFASINFKKIEGHPDLSVVAIGGNLGWKKR